MRKGASLKAGSTYQFQTTQNESSTAAFSSPRRIISMEDPKGDNLGKTLDEETKRRITEIMDFALDKSEASIRHAAKEIGLHVITKNQYNVMEWGMKQLQIRRLQDECDHILGEIKVS